MDRDDSADEIERSLSRLSAATDGLAPAPELTDAVLARMQDSPARTGATLARVQGSPAEPLAVIARATSSLDAADGLTDAVMANVQRGRRSAPRPAPSWLDGVVRSGPIAVGLAAVAAAASFLIFLSGQSDLDSAMASSIDTVEVGE